ncbi:MAG TPA: SMC-Scp complex subunit ScpB [Methylococcaceae bacterium]|nr:SMC-Scp complex subunit ScpB [Methylococcaceae bacterium]
MDIKRIVEALLFASDKPMTVKQLQQTFPELEQPELDTLQQAVDEIAEDYAQRPIALKKVASGYRFQVKPELSFWVGRLFEEKPPKYSRALLETLAIIAYRQPVTRGDIEDIRGVAVSSNIIRTLLEREWIRIVAHKEVPGRPALYGTTKQFLDYFDLSSLHELPTLQEIKELDLSVASNQQLMQEQSEQQENNRSEVTEQRQETELEAEVESSVHDTEEIVQ